MVPHGYLVAPRLGSSRTCPAIQTNPTIEESQSSKGSLFKKRFGLCATLRSFTGKEEEHGIRYFKSIHVIPECSCTGSRHQGQSLANMIFSRATTVDNCSCWQRIGSSTDSMTLDVEEKWSDEWNSYAAV